MTIGFRRTAPRVAAFIAAGALGACSFTGGGPRPAETPPPPPAAMADDGGIAAAAPAPPLATAPAPAFRSAAAPVEGAPSRLLRRRASELANELSGLARLIESQRAELRELAGGAGESAELYVAAVDAVRDRLREGASPDDPILVAQWRSAQTALQAVAAAYSARLQELGERIEGNSGMAAYLSESTRAARSVHDALGADRSAIAGVESELARVMGDNDRLLAELGQTFARYAGYLDGSADGALAALEPAAGMAAAPLPRAGAGGPALVVIRFDRGDADFENALYDAVSAALQRRPDARFELVAVSPAAGGAGEAARHAEAAARNAGRVMDSLIAMNLPADRLQLAFSTSPDARVGEVRVFAR